MSKEAAVFSIRAFKANLAIVPNWPILKKVVKELNSSMAKRIAERIKADTLIERIENAEKLNQFSEIQEALAQWCDHVLTEFDHIDSMDFEVKRGRDSANVVVELFGRKETAQKQAAGLVKNSKLAELLGGKLTGEFTPGQWADLHTVLVCLRNVLDTVVDEKYKPKRKAKVIASTGTTETEATSE